MIDRRDFLRYTAAGAAGSSLLGMAPWALGATRKAAPSDTVNIGVIGLRNIGRANLSAHLKLPDVKCVAYCDIDENIMEERAAEFSDRVGGKPKRYTDYRKMLEDKDIDAVLVNTPDHWHALQTIHACQAGKDVYVEKPLSNTVEECLAMVKAVRDNKRVVQVGQQQRSGVHWQTCIEYIHSGKLGKISSAKAWKWNEGREGLPKVPDGKVPDGVDYDMWLGPAPARPFNENHFHYNFRWFWEYAGGLMTDWGVHLIDIVLYGMKAKGPVSVMSSGGKFAHPDDARQTPDTQQAIYQFEDFLMSWEHTFNIGSAPFGLGHGIAFYGENATLIASRRGWEVVPLTIHEDGQALRKYKIDPVPFQGRSGDPRVAHSRNFIDCVKSREDPICTIETGANVAMNAALGNISYRLGRKIYWDSEKQMVKDDKEAQALASANYRDPWKLP